MTHVYANTAAVGRLHPAAVTAMRGAIADLSQPNFYVASYPRLSAEIGKVRDLVAQLLGVETSSVALTSSTSDGLAMFEAALSLSPGDVIAVNPGTFISIGASLLRLQLAGVKVVPLGEIYGCVRPDHLSASPSRTRLIVLDWVNYWSGYRNDVQPLVEWSRRTNIPLLLDGVQAIGAVQVDFDIGGVAGLACGGHKWLRGPEGTGFLYIAPWMQPRLTPQHHGYRSLSDPAQLEASRLELSVDARVFEVGTLNTIGFAGLAGVMKDLLDRGMARTAERIQETATAVRRMLTEFPDIEIFTPAESAHCAGIVSFRHSTVPSRIIVDRLAGIGVTVGMRRGLVRISAAADVPTTDLFTPLRRVLNEM